MTNPEIFLGQKDAQKLEPCGASGNTDSNLQVRIIQVPPKCAPITAVNPQISGSINTPSVMVFGKATNAGGLSLTKPQVGVSQVPSINQVTTGARTLVITVPRSTVPSAVTPILPQTATHPLPPNIHVPPGMMLIRSDSGQLMMVSQQIFAQVQQGSRVNQGPRPLGIRAPTQIPPCDTKKDPPKMFSQETLESVKKCKNFLITLIRLASSDSRSATMAQNVRGLVRNLLEGKMEADEFTERLYEELKSTPQPCLIPFLKKSIPAVRALIADSESFIQQALNTSSNTTTTPANSTKQSGQNIKTKNAQEVTLKSGLSQSRSEPTKRSGIMSRYLNSSGKLNSWKQTFPGPSAPKVTFGDTLTSCKDDDDINDVPSMAGVNLTEENDQILITTVGSVVQSCQDPPFLSPQPALSLILCKGETVGVSDVAPEVVALVSHATQEFLRNILEKVTIIAHHGRATFKDDEWHTKVSDVRAQLRFLEDIEKMKQKRKEEEDRLALLRWAKVRTQSENPELLQLKQKARELQQLEAAQMQQKEANITALAAIGPRKKRPLDPANGQVSLVPRHEFQRVTRVMLKDLVVCMEQDPFLRHSLFLYKSMMAS